MHLKKMVFLVMCLMSQGSFAVDCQRITDAISVRYTLGFGKVVTAGDQINLEVTVSISDVSAFDSVPSIPISFLMTNGLPGSKGFDEFLWIKENQEDRVEPIKTYSISFKVPSTFVGRYSAGSNIFAYFNDDLCRKNFGREEQASIDVLNNGISDISPPVITDVVFDKPSYHIGDTTTVEISVNDQSEICTSSLKEAGKCEAVWHAAFENESTREYVNVYEPITNTGTPGKFKFSFVVLAADEENQNLFSPGSYRITVVNLYDKPGNIHVELISSNQKTILIEP